MEVATQNTADFNSIVLDATYVAAGVTKIYQNGGQLTNTCT